MIKAKDYDYNLDDLYAKFKSGHSIYLTTDRIYTHKKTLFSKEDSNENKVLLIQNISSSNANAVTFELFEKTFNKQYSTYINKSLKNELGINDFLYEKALIEDLSTDDIARFISIGDLFGDRMDDDYKEIYAVKKHKIISSVILDNLIDIIKYVFNSNNKNIKNFINNLEGFIGDVTGIISYDVKIMSDINRLDNYDKSLVFKMIDKDKNRSEEDIFNEYILNLKSNSFYELEYDFANDTLPILQDHIKDESFKFRFQDYIRNNNLLTEDNSRLISALGLKNFSIILIEELDDKRSENNEIFGRADRILTNTDHCLYLKMINDPLVVKYGDKLEGI